MNLVDRYRIVRFHHIGGPEVLQLETASLPEPRAGEVAIKVLGIGMTQGDAMYRSGTYLETPELPSGLGTEVGGEVIAVGEGVTRWKVGDRASSLSSMSINRYPIYGEYALLPEASLVKTPSDFDDLEASGFSLAFLPMYFALIREAKVKAGEWVLLNAAAATTSLAACQIAKLGGARVIGVARNPDKVEPLRELGFDHVLVWADDIVDQVMAITGNGVDVVLDPVMGDCCQALGEMSGWRGRIVHYGALGSAEATHSIYQMAPKYLTIKGFTIYGYSGSQVMNLSRNNEAMAEAEAFLEQGVAAGALKPLIADTYSLDQIVEAHQALEGGNHIGKLVVIP